MMISSGGAIVEDTAAGANQILHGDLSWGAIDLSTAEVTGVLPVANGGTGASTLTQDGILLGNGSSAVSAVALASDKILVGNTGSAPTARGIVAGNGINIGIDGSNITISNTSLGTSSANGQASYTSGGGQQVVVTPGPAVSTASRIILTAMDNTTHNMISTSVIDMTVGAAGVGTFTIAVSTDVDCVVNWIIINP